MVVSNWNSQEPFGVIWVYGSVVITSAKLLACVNKVVHSNSALHPAVLLLLMRTQLHTSTHKSKRLLLVPQTETNLKH